jgi:hypothetical protein
VALTEDQIKEQQTMEAFKRAAALLQGGHCTQQQESLSCLMTSRSSSKWLGEQPELFTPYESNYGLDKGIPSVWPFALLPTLLPA